MRKGLLTLFTSILFFVATTSFSQVTLLSNNTNLQHGLVINNRGLLISESDSLWVTDGTAGGTTKLINTVRYSDTGAAVYKGKLFFTGITAANGYELWSTDATTGGTAMVKDINTGTANSYAKDYHVYNNTLFFAANNGVYGMELWSSDGTTGGTSLLKDINPTGNGLNNIARFSQANGLLFFVANDGVNGEELWKTDGTAAGTNMVANLTTGSGSTTFLEFSKVGSTLVLAIRKGSFFDGQLELWRSDGTAAGTTLLKNFGNESGFFPPFFYPFNNKLYFIGSEAATGAELWTTDATVAGTSLVKDINPGEDDGFPFTFNAITINNKFYFQAATAANGTELWVSDGTNSGTQMLKDINLGEGDSDPFIYKNFDAVAADGTFGNTLYNGKIFFQADDGVNGTELWITDGTAVGTVMVKNMAPGAASGIDTTLSYYYTNAGIYFSGTNGVNGYEPWVSNGTEAGTVPVFDVNPGPAGSDPEFIFIYNNQLYFTANNGDNNVINRDLFKINGLVQPLPINLLNFSLTKQSAGTVKVDWEVTNEINSSHYIVERSVDGVNYFEIGKVNSSNNAGRQGYSFIDQDAGKQSKEILYYRIKMTDRDGSFKRTNTLKVSFSKASFQFTFTPNPVQRNITLSVVTAGAKSVAMRIIDAAGKVVYQQVLPTAQTSYQQNIGVEHLQKGMYFLQLITDGKTQSEQFVKQ